MSLSEGDVAPDLGAAHGWRRHARVRRAWAASPMSSTSIPKDDTPGCTKEALGFARALPAVPEARASRSSASPRTASPATTSSRRNMPLLPAGGRRRRRRGGRGVRHLGREEHVRQEVHGHGPLDLPDRRRRADHQGWRNVKVPGHVEEVLEAAKDRRSGALDSAARPSIKAQGDGRGDVARRPFRRTPGLQRARPRRSAG